jgi:hypothetical protein
MEKKDVMLELLRVNYNNLHESMWNNHRVSWIVTSIFIPVLFAMLGYLVREYDAITRIQALMGFFVVESLLIIWLLIMRIFEHYNDVRRKRLKEIENIFNKKIFNDIPLFTLNLDPKELEPVDVIEKLKDLFKEKNISLTDEAKLYPFPMKSIWKIEDSGMSYIIKEVDKQLKVYETDFAQYNLDYKQRPKQLKLSPMKIYYLFAVIYTALNIGLLIAKFNFS